MPFFDPVPIDPDLLLRGDLGPGRENRLDDRTKLASAIEKKTDAAPHAELGRFGTTLAQRFAGRSGGRRDSALPPGFLGAIGAAQVRRGTDPDAVVLKDGPTRDALRGTKQSDASGGFAPLPKIARPVGPPPSSRAPNRPGDARVLQGKLASLGYLPRVTETPPFYPSGERTVPETAGGLQTLLDAVAAFQRDKRLKEDRLVSPGGPTERALDAQNEKARKARLDRLETVSREIMESDESEYAEIADRAAADSMAGLIVANEVQNQRREKLAEKPDGMHATDSLRKSGPQIKRPDSSKKPGEKKQENNDTDEKNLNDLSFDFSGIPPVLEKFDDNHIELLEDKDYWKNRATLVEILAELGGKSDVAGFVGKTIAAERQEAAARLRNIPDIDTGRPGIVLTGGRGGGRQRPRQQRSIGREITLRGIDLRAEKLLKQIRKYDPGFWRYQFREPGQSPSITRDNIRLFEETLRRHQARETAEIRKQSGTAWSARKLPTMKPGQEWLRGTHRNAGFIPEHIAAKLRGQSFGKFDRFRSKFWKAIAADPILSRQFRAKDLARMRRGNAPQTDKTQWRGKRKSYEIHHANPIREGGAVYDMRNMIILTPHAHKYIIPQ